MWRGGRGCGEGASFCLCLVCQYICIFWSFGGEGDNYVVWGRGWQRSFRGEDAPFLRMPEVVRARVGGKGVGMGDDDEEEEGGI